MSEKIYLKNNKGDNVFCELFRGGMFDKNIVLIVQNNNNKIQEAFYEELISNLIHNHIPYFRLYNFDQNNYSLLDYSDTLVKSMDYLKNYDFDNFIIFGKESGAIQALIASKQNKNVRGLILVNPYDKDIKDLDSSDISSKINVLQSGDVEKERIDFTKNLLKTMNDGELEILEGADLNFSFIRDYRRMYRSVIEFIIENK